MPRNDIAAGFFCISKTLQRVQKRLRWPDVDEYAETWASSCHQCQ